MKKTAIYFLIFSLIVLAGGIMGYLTKGSLPSLISGTICGTLLFANAIWLLKRPSIKPLYTGLALTFLIDGFFTYRFIKTGAFFPAGMMCALCLLMIFILVSQIRHALSRKA